MRAYIGKAIATVDPDAEVTTDTVSRRITVTTSASREAIQKALAAGGYPAKSV